MSQIFFLLTASQPPKPERRCPLLCIRRWRALLWQPATPASPTPPAGARFCRLAWASHALARAGPLTHSSHAPARSQDAVPARLLLSPPSCIRPQPRMRCRRALLQPRLLASAQSPAPPMRWCMIQSSWFRNDRNIYSTICLKTVEKSNKIWYRSFFSNGTTCLFTLYSLHCCRTEIVNLQ